MSKSLTTDMPNDDAELKAAIEKIFIEIEHEHEQMKLDREEFERSKARTKEMLAALKAAWTIMWKQFYEWAKWLFLLAQEMRQIRADVNEV